MCQRSVVAAVAAGTLWMGVAASGQEAFFSGLGDLPGGRFASRARAISADGSTVVGYVTSSQGKEPFRWTLAEGMVGLGNLPGGDYSGGAHDVSANGSVIVGRSESANGPEAFRWTAATGLVGLGDLPGGEFESMAKAVSANGNVIVGWSESAHSVVEGFRWTPSEGMIPMGFLADSTLSASEATALSADGSVIVGWALASWEDLGEAQAFRWTAAEGLVGLGFLPGGRAASFANAVTPDGTIIAGDSYDESMEGLRGFRWTSQGGMVHLDPNGDAIELAYAISADGSVIVGEGPDRNAVIWDPVHGTRDLKQVLVRDYGLDLSGWRLSEAWDVSGDGTVIVGAGMNHGKREGWIAYLGWVPDDFPSPPGGGDDDGDDGGGDDDGGDDDGSYGNQWPPPWGDPYGGDTGSGYGSPDDHVAWPDVLLTDEPDDDSTSSDEYYDGQGGADGSGGQTQDADGAATQDDGQQALSVPSPGLLCPAVAVLLTGVPLLLMAFPAIRRR